MTSGKSSAWESLFGPPSVGGKNCTCDLIPCLCDDSSEWVTSSSAPPPVFEAPTVSTEDQQLLLNPGAEGAQRVFLDAELSVHLKPHQQSGIRFLWRAIEADDGCVLADHMGLGKTLQLICGLSAFFDADERAQALLRPSERKATRAMVIAPAFVLANWKNEIARWLPGDRRLRARMLPTTGGGPARFAALRDWHANGGTLLVGYEMFRQIVAAACTAAEKLAKAAPSMKAADFKAGTSANFVGDDEGNDHRMAFQALCDPGPGILILDEAHRLKEPKSQLYRALSKVKTHRRILASGYPVQNRLDEYWALVSFAKPDALGHYDAFRNYFERPITLMIDAAMDAAAATICNDGETVVSTTDGLAQTEAVAMRRAHALQAALKPIVLRRGVEELGDALPRRTDWVVRCALSSTQRRLYAAFEAVNLLSGGATGELAQYHTALAIVNHPDIIHAALVEEERLFSPSTAPLRPAPANGGGGWIAPEVVAKQSREWRAQKARDDARRAKQSKKVSAQTARKLLDEDASAETDELAAYLEAAAEGAELSSWARPVLRPLLDAVLDAAEDDAAVRVESGDASPEAAAGDDDAGFVVGQVAGRYGSGKTAVALAIMQSAVAKGESVIVFTQTLGTLDVLARMMRARRIRFRRIDGATPPPLRATIRSVSQRDDDAPCDVLLMSIKAGGEGINLTGASRVILFDVCWNPCFDQQAMCRAHRFGQRKPVHVYRLVGPRGTMEERVLRQQRRKELLVREVIECSETESAKQHVTLCVYGADEDCDDRAIADDVLADVIRSVPKSIASIHECAVVDKPSADEADAVKAVRQRPGADATAGAAAGAAPAGEKPAAATEADKLDALDAFATRARIVLSDVEKADAVEEYRLFNKGLAPHQK
ncbi:P-loop containing nucleoside triphosphate hydrolase protein [Pelagophyceae sp. CCMP2097]|nr:P-loop containing nucleoside triphosphate hydrolase protein [Pelagophyceae sp. CCMP2097]